MRILAATHYSGAPDGTDAPPTSEFLLSSPAVIRREPVADDSETTTEIGEEVISMGKKSRERLSYWQRIRRDEYGQPLPGALPDAREVSTRHMGPQHIMYIK